MSAPAIKHPGLAEMRTALVTALFAHTSFITSVISFCIWMDSVLTWRVGEKSQSASHRYEIVME